MWRLGNQTGPPIMSAQTQVVVAPVPTRSSDLPFISEPISPFHKMWPVAGLVVAMIVNVAWMGFLGYGFFKLVEPAFF
jgi:hypothetical protein